MGHGGDASPEQPLRAPTSAYLQEFNEFLESPDPSLDTLAELVAKPYTTPPPGHRDHLRQILAQNNGNLNAAADQLLGPDAIRPAALSDPAPHRADASAKQRSVSPPRVASRGRPPLHPGPPAAKFTEGLTAHRRSSSRSSAREERQSRDEQLARQLQRHIIQDNASSTMSHAQRDKITQTAPPSFLDIPDVRNALIANLRDQMVPSLIDYLSTAVFPDITREQGSVTYKLRDMRLRQFSVPDESLVVMYAGGWLQVHFIDINLHLEVGQWAFQRQTMFGSFLGGQGTAVAAIQKVHASIRMYPVGEPSPHSIDDEDAAASLPPMGVAAARVRVQNVDILFQSHGITPAWVYNTLAVVMRPVVHSMVEDVLREAIIAGLRSQAGS